MGVFPEHHPLARGPHRPRCHPCSIRNLSKRSRQLAHLCKCCGACVSETLLLGREQRLLQHVRPSSLVSSQPHRVAMLLEGAQQGLCRPELRLRVACGEGGHVGGGTVACGMHGLAVNCWWGCYRGH